MPGRTVGAYPHANYKWIEKLFDSLSYPSEGDQFPGPYPDERSASPYGQSYCGVVSDGWGQAAIYGAGHNSSNRFGPIFFNRNVLKWRQEWSAFNE